jgi:hypothetical protein
MLPGRVLDYFWLIAAGFMLLTAAVFHARAGTLVRAGRVTDEERRRFAIGLGAWTAGFCLLVQAVVWLTGESRTECLAALPPNSPASLATTALTVLGWAALLLWVWRGRGAKTLASFAPAVIRSSSSAGGYSPVQVRRFVTGFVIVSTLGSVVASRIAPPPPDCRGRPAEADLSALRSP